MLMRMLTFIVIVSLLPTVESFTTKSIRSTEASISLQDGRFKLRSSSDDKFQTNEPWLEKGLLLSSFTDGLQSRKDVQGWLYDALLERLWNSLKIQKEQALEKSNRFSPCNGPDPTLWKQLEEVDRKVEGFYQTDKVDAIDNVEIVTSASSWRKILKLLLELSENQPELRVLYIPTALYALRNDSTNTPGKQRQRARVDGKKRRDALVQLLEENLQGVSIAVVTLDFDDGSVKQPESTTANQKSEFPKCGKEAFVHWNPHLIYVQGGNTFWLHHCMEKGNWASYLTEACCNISRDGTTLPAVYCGVSAGAILVGKFMQTACWKEWDDPSVVPGKESYEDWTHVTGLGLVGSTSFFPHMEEQWQDMVEQRRNELPTSGVSNNQLSQLCTLQEDQVCLVDGPTQSMHSNGMQYFNSHAAMLRK